MSLAARSRPKSRRALRRTDASDSEYIAYLESKVQSLESKVHSLESKVQSLIAHPRPPSPPSPPPSFDGDNDFKIVQYLPGSSTQDFSRPAKRQRTQDRWEHEMDAMLSDINGHDLVSRRKSVRLSSSSDILLALDLIVDGKTPRTELVASDTNLSVVCYDSYHALAQRLNSFAIGTAALGIEKTLLAQVYHFRMLVLVSACCVALDRAVPMRVIEDVMRKCVSDTTEKNLSRLRGGVYWVNRMMCALAADGLRHVAYELFILWGAPIARYGRFAERGDAAFERFRKGVQVCKPGPEMQSALPFLIPYFVKTIVGDIYSLSDIWAALGYGELQVVDYSSWHNYQQRKIPLPQSGIVELTAPRGEGSFNGCGTAKENQTTSDFNNKRTGARVTPSNEESATTAALISACSQHLSPSISAAPVRTPDLVSSATQLHGSMAEPGGVDSLVGGCAMGGTHQEQLTRRDWQYEPPNVFNAGDSYDFPAWLDVIDLPLFSAQSYFDVFGNPEQLSENHSVEA